LQQALDCLNELVQFLLSCISFRYWLWAINPKEPGIFVFLKIS